MILLDKLNKKNIFLSLHNISLSNCVCFFRPHLDLSLSLSHSLFSLPLSHSHTLSLSLFLSWFDLHFSLLQSQIRNPPTPPIAIPMNLTFPFLIYSSFCVQTTVDFWTSNSGERSMPREPDTLIKSGTNISRDIQLNTMKRRRRKNEKKVDKGEKTKVTNIRGKIQRENKEKEKKTIKRLKRVNQEKELKKKIRKQTK